MSITGGFIEPRRAGRVPGLAHRTLRPLLCVMSLMALAGCDHIDITEAARHLPPYQKPIDRPKTVIDLALDRCPEKTDEQETICVKQAVAGRHLSLAALAALVPGCRMGRICHYGYTTDDRMGYVPVLAEDFIARWSVSLDFTHAKSAADVPITVEQR